MRYTHKNLLTDLAHYNRILRSTGIRHWLEAEQRSGYTAIDVVENKPKPGHPIYVSFIRTLITGTPRQALAAAQEYYIGRLESHITYLNENLEIVDKQINSANDSIRAAKELVA